MTGRTRSATCIGLVSPRAFPLMRAPNSSLRRCAVYRTVRLIQWYPAPAARAGAMTRIHQHKCSMCGMLWEHDHQLQVGFFIPKGSFPDLRARPVAEWTDELIFQAPV